ncbi:MAG TPA: outer membrane beta-barrel protein [Gammaproteobacteria bacterium]|nr:outer membrane beta-barrel protein [Gammaproteobacteria bacterium]
MVDAELDRIGGARTAPPKRLFPRPRFRARPGPCAAVALLALAFGGYAGAAAAQSQRSGDRAKTWEIGFNAFNAYSDALSGQGGSSLHVDSAIGFGGVASYNLTNRVAVLGEINWSHPDYRADLKLDNGTGTVEAIHGNLDVATVLLKGLYYFSESDFSPYIEFGAGWSRIDSNIANGQPSTGCWWEPWWGYVCAQSFDTYHDTRTTYTGAFGVRWDIDPSLLLKLSWGVLEIDAGARTEQSSQDVFRVEFSWKM